MQKVERLVNLIALLLNTRRPMTVDEIRNTVPGYQQEDYASFKRMFERDKEELRTLGIPIERRYTDVWEVEEGYLIPKERYYLPELDLTPEELAALSIVSGITVEQGAKEDQALVKLSLGTGFSAEPAAPPGMRARLHLDTPSLPVLLDAVATRRRIKFGYKAAGRSTATDRVVEPYALIHARSQEDILRRQGAWYLVGRDQKRSAVRHFKLQRMTSPVAFANKGMGPDFEVPDDFTTEGRPFPEPWAAENGGRVVEIAFSPRIAWWAEQALGLQPSAMWKDWTVVKLNVVDEEGFISWILGFGEDAVIRTPARLRRELVARLRPLARAKK